MFAMSAVKPSSGQHISRYLVITVDCSVNSFFCFGVFAILMKTTYYPFTFPFFLQCVRGASERNSLSDNVYTDRELFPGAWRIFSCLY